MRNLLRSGGLAQPDRVDYDEGSVILRWNGPKLAVIVDLDGPPDGGASPDPLSLERTPG
jgi:hypothetical protein